MEVETKLLDSVIMLTPHGRIDTASAGEFEKALNAVISGGNKKIIVVFASVDYISSAGLRVLLLIGKRLKVTKGNIALSDMSERIFEVFKISGFNKILTICATADEARKSIAF
ncbi:MAG: STAS domain-containing protein [Holosporales bacterium]|jgi:anti-anti-sigma factor|nr:STAS domain-containing protein [Holosporales bacterium]